MNLLKLCPRATKTESAILEVHFAEMNQAGGKNPEESSQAFLKKIKIKNEAKLSICENTIPFLGHRLDL